MKILMIAEGMDIGGAETHVLTLIRALMKRGDTVTLLSMGGRYREELRKEGVRCIDVPSGKRDPLSLYACAHTLRRLMREGYDCIHAHTRGMAALVRYTTSMPLVVTAHLDFPVGPIRRALASFGDHTLAVSEDLSQYLTREYGVQESDVTLTRNGIDTDRFQACTGNLRTIVHVSRFDRDRSRCALLLCEIAPKLLHAFPDTKILLCGDGNDGKCIQTCANRANKELGHEGIIYLGGRTDIQEVLKKGAIFVGVSRCALEAMSVGAAVVLAGNDGYGGILRRENFSYHAKSNFCARGEVAADATSLYADLKTLLDDPALVEECVRGGRRLIQEDYTPTRMAADAHVAYESAIRKRRERVALLGFFGYGNFGDELTRRMLNDRLRGYRVTTLVRGFRRKEGEANRFFAVKRAIRHSGTLVFGGGNLFQNTTSERSLLYYTTLLRYAKARGCRTVLLGGGIGDFKNARGRTTMQAALPYFDRLACRTESDRHRAAAMGAGTVEYLPDPCFLYQREHAPLTEDARITRTGKTIVILPHGRQKIGRETFLFNARADGYRLVFIPLFSKEDDALCRRLARRYQGEYPPYLSVDRMTDLLASADLVITERLHGAILSLLAHTPAYLLDDSTKARGLLQDCERYCHERNLRSPLFPFSYYAQIHTNEKDAPFHTSEREAGLHTSEGEKQPHTSEKRAQIYADKKETEGRAFGFSELITYFRSFYKTDPLL